MTRLTSLHVAGFRSLRDVAVTLTPATVLIGANGSGKSNLLAALEMVRHLAFDSLQRFVSERGGASFLMHNGPKVSPVIDIRLEFGGDRGDTCYEARLAYGDDESLYFMGEKAGHRSVGGTDWCWTDLGGGHRESRLGDEAETDGAARTVRFLLRQINYYHFHDTSRGSPLRSRAFADTSSAFLRSDGSNLPAFLHGLMTRDGAGERAAWRRIVGLLRQVAPFIQSLEPTEDRHGFHLGWRDENGVDFGPAHLSDGTLRFLALLAALGQPEDSLPLVSCIDEPELGLHPAAIGILCGLIESVCVRRQVILASQSPVILDLVDPDWVIVAERHDGATRFHRLDTNDLDAWLEDYSLSELYDKNLLGGLP